MVNQDTPKLQTLQIINSLDQTGALKLLVKSGIVSCKVYQHLDIFNYVNAQMASGLRKKVAVLNAEDHFGVGEATVYRVLKEFR